MGRIKVLYLWFFTTALAVSGFYGVYAFAIFGGDVPTKRSQRAHQFWFNFVGSLFGWVALFFLVQKFMPVASGAKVPDVGFWDVVLSLIAFAGITGHLPWVFVDLKFAIAAIAKKAMG